MDTKQLTESDLVTIALVNGSASKRLVILSAGAMVNDKDGNSRFQCLVEMDGQSKKWRPNKTTMRSLQQKFGYDSSAWVGKVLSLSCGKIEGKDAIIGTPQ